ncbi:MAG: transglycosylase domain-containing protein [Chlorobiales bacterium]|jgi:monofunctional glycosyltransferase|nr:transglycosylase domain-containing protein [Chlorobiales bacterium]
MRSLLFELLKAIFTSKAFLRTVAAVLSLLTLFLLSFVTYAFYIEAEYKDLILNLKNHNPTTTSLIEERKSNSGLNKNEKLEWLAFSEIPPLMISAVITGEDPNFFSHKGFNFKAIRNALMDNINDGSFSKGGSTISQQLAKNLFLSTEKTLERKAVETFITISLEKNLSKERILELYLNVVEFGPSTFGVKKASKTFFNKAVSDLNTEEIIRLITVLPKPSSVHPTQDDEWLLTRATFILERLNRQGVITKQDYCRTYRSLHNIDL